jgi:negative regulator of flagellin synthesis FlgM
MKIDNSSLKSLTGGKSIEDSGRTAKKTAGDTAAAVSSDHVEISTMSSSMQAIEKGFADTPIVDSARVDEIKQAIANGHFKVDAGKVADRLLKTVQELIYAHKA